MSEQYRQIGNAVPPLLAYEIGKEIKKSIENLRNKCKKYIIKSRYI